MNGNANLNANNLTTQNVEDWRKKLGIDLIGKVEEIYKNSTPYVSQSATTITPNVDMTQYSGFVIIYVRQTTTQTLYFSTNFKTANSNQINNNIIGVYGGYLFQRNCNINLSTNKIIIGENYKQTNFGSYAVDNTANMIYSVYGII